MGTMSCPKCGKFLQGKVICPKCGYDTAGGAESNKPSLPEPAASSAQAKPRYRQVQSPSNAMNTAPVNTSADEGFNKPATPPIGTRPQQPPRQNTQPDPEDYDEQEETENTVDNEEDYESPQDTDAEEDYKNEGYISDDDEEEDENDGIIEETFQQLLATNAGKKEQPSNKAKVTKPMKRKPITKPASRKIMTKPEPEDEDFYEDMDESEDYYAEVDDAEEYAEYEEYDPDIEDVEEIYEEDLLPEPPKVKKPAAKKVMRFTAKKEKPRSNMATQKSVPEYNPNHDHYYDDLLPEYEAEIDKMPKEVIIRGVAFALISVVCVILAAYRLI